MKLRKSVKRLNESGPIDFMTLVRKAVNRARLNESAEEEGLDTTEGLDELGSEDEGVGVDDADFDDDDLAGGEDREMVTITVPVDATIEEVVEAIEAAKAGSDEEEALDDEAEAAADEAADDAEAAAAADAAADEAGFDQVEEDEEAFASTRAEGPVRKIASTTYKNQMTVDSNTSATTTMGKPAVIADGSPKRRPAAGTYNNDLTVRSNIQPGARIFR